MNLMTTMSGSLLENFYPKGWDLEKIDECCSHNPKQIFERQSFWNDNFKLKQCDDVVDFNMMLGHEIALEIKRTRDEGRQLALVLPVGPMGMYRWVIFFLQEWGVDAHHVHGFNMDEWSDINGNTLPTGNPAAFENAMQNAFYGPLGSLTVPQSQRNFATKENLPQYPDKIGDLKAKGAKLVTVFGIGRVFHIAFWEPHFAAEFDTLEAWKKQSYRLGAKLHPLTVEQNALTSFKSRTTLVPCFANTIGPNIFLNSERIIGGADGTFGRGMQWQGVSLWTTLRYGPDKWIPSSFMPTLPGKLFFVKELAGPLEAECN